MFVSPCANYFGSWAIEVFAFDDSTFYESNTLFDMQDFECKSGPFEIFEWNGDGYQDLMGPSSTTAWTATWNGKKFNGKKVATGVYLFLCTNVDFTESIVKKILIYN